MSNIPGHVATVVTTNDGEASPKRSRSLRRLFPGSTKGHSQQSSISSMASMNSSLSPLSPTPSSRSNGPPVTYNGRFSPNPQPSQYPPRKQSSESYRSIASTTAANNGGQAPYLSNIRPPLSEAARQRGMNSGQYSVPSSPSRPYHDMPLQPQSENFSRPRKPSLKQNCEHSRPAIHTGNSFPPQQRMEATPPAAFPPPRALHERGVSTSSTTSKTHLPIRSLKNSIGIPDLGAQRESPQMMPPPRHESSFTDKSIGDGNDGTNTYRDGYGRAQPADLATDSMYSNQTTATNATASTWVSSTSTTTWTPAGSFLDTERSSVRSKSSTNSLAGREAIDDLLGMYEDGFESGVEDEKERPRPETLRSLMAEDAKEREATIATLIKDESDRSRLPEASPTPDSMQIPTPPPPLPGLETHIVGDSTEMFTRPTMSEKEDKFIDPFHIHPVTQNGMLEPYTYTKRQPTSLSEAIAELNGAQTPASMFDNSRDRYGFKKKGQHVSQEAYDAWDRSYEDHLTRRRRKWVRLLQECGLETDQPRMFPPKSSKTKRFIRKGIPPDWRGEAWFWYGGGPAMLAQNPGLYAELVHKAANGRVSSTDEELIERDLNRTFPDNILFKPDRPISTRASDGSIETETPLLKKLRRVLQATSIYNPRIGYCQSLNFLAGLLLLFMDEERAFWMLDIITKVYLPGTHEVNLEGANVDLGVLMTSIKESMPAVWDKIGGELDGSRRPPTSDVTTMRLPPITLCCTAWFMSCFIGTLPIETTLRVWDAFFYEGSKTLFRIALAIFKVGEEEIRRVQDPMEIFQVVQTIPRRLVDANQLMEACFKRRNGFGHLSQETVDGRRRERREGYRDEREGRKVRLSDGTNGRPRSRRGLHLGIRKETGKVFDSVLHRK